MCSGDSTGEASVIVLNGVPPYNITWSNGATTDSIDSLAPNVYSITLFDSRGCGTFGNTTIEDAQPITLGLAPTDISCFGETDGTIDATVVGGKKPYAYSWSNGRTTQDIANLGVNNYVLTLTDANGCLVKDSAQIIQPTLVAASFAVNEIKCNGGTDGGIDLTVNGGVLPYSFNWSNGDTTEDLDSITSGGYTVIINDGNNCTLSTPLVIGVTEPDSLHFDSVIFACPAPGVDSTLVTVYPDGGTGGPYYISFDNGATYGALSDYDTYLKTDSTYLVWISDTNGCISIDPVSIYVNPTVVIDSIVYDPCSIAGGASQIQVYPNGGIGGNYQLSTDSGATYLAYGDYSENLTINSSYYIAVRDSLGCASMVDSIHIFDSLYINAIISSNYNGTDISCNGLSDGVVATVSGGGDSTYTYLWSNGDNNDSLLAVPANKYVVTLTDGNGCVAQDSVTLTEPGSITSSTSVLSNYNGQDVSCTGASDGMGFVTSSGGNGIHTYLWSNATTNDTLFNVGAGKYYVTITDANGCSELDSVVVSEPTPLVSTTSVISNYNGEDISCTGLSNGIAGVSVTGGTGAYTYLWSNATTNAILFKTPI